MGVREEYDNVSNNYPFVLEINFQRNLIFVRAINCCKVRHVTLAEKWSGSLQPLLEVGRSTQLLGFWKLNHLSMHLDNIKGKIQRQRKKQNAYNTIQN